MFRAILLAGAAAPACLAGPACAAPVFSIIHGFINGAGGASPTQIMGYQSDASDPTTWALYGTTSYGGSTASTYCHDIGGCGTVFKLTPPAAGATSWRASTLHAFRGAPDGARPFAGVAADASGALYGTTSYGGTNANSGNGRGTVFRLALSVDGSWAETVLHRFAAAPDGEVPIAGVAVAPNGTLYGTTYHGGAADYGIVFQLTPPAAGDTLWAETEIDSFTGGTTDGGYPEAPVILDASGALYGTVNYGGGWGNGTAFELTPPAPGSTAWTSTVLTSFDGPDGVYPAASLVADGAGNFYGTTTSGGHYSYGDVFELSPPAAGATSWTETVLYSFTGKQDGGTPASGLYRNAKGTLYGIAAVGGDLNCGHGVGCGAVFEIAAPKKGSTAWREAVLHAFHGFDGFPSNQATASSLVAGPDGAIYGSTTYGGPKNNGVVFQITQ